MRRLQLIVGIVGLGLVAGAIATPPASGGAVKPATRSFLVDGAETPRPQLEQVLTAGRRDGLSEIGAIDRWLATRGGSRSRTASRAPHLDNLDDAEIQDLRAYAVQWGEPFSWLVRWYGDQEEFQAASWRLEELFPDSYAGMRFHDQGVAAWMGFNGTVPPAALALIRTLPGDVKVEVGDLLPKAKWGQYVTAAKRRVNALADRSEVGFDIRTQQIVVKVPLSTRPSDASIAAAVTNALPGTAAAVQHTLMNGRGADDDTARGGGYQIGYPDTRNRICTFGYVIRSLSSGTKRLLTAGHCMIGINGEEDYLYQNHPSDGGQTRVIQRWKLYNPSNPDFGYTDTGTMTAYPSFYYDFDLKREVHTAAQGRADFGDHLCHFGRETGQACGPVINPVYNVDDACCQTLVGAPRAEGDSGGPWYWGYMAFGIHHGYPPGDPTISSFSPIYMLKDKAPGWDIWTTG